MLDFIKKAYSQNGEPSSSRLHTGYIVVIFGAALVYGFVWCLYNKPELIISYSNGLLLIIAGALGIQAARAITTPQQDAAPEAQPTDQPTQ